MESLQSASNRSKLIVALVPSVSGSVFAETLESMRQVLEQAGYQLLIGQTGYEESHADALLDAAIGRRPAGIVLTGVVHSGTSRLRLAGAGIPVAETWDLTASPIDVLVGFSHAQVGATAARYLHSRGARHAVVITPNDRRALTRPRCRPCASAARKSARRRPRCGCSGSNRQTLCRRPWTSVSN